MAKFTQLRDFYSFPDFTPSTHIHGVSGDPYAAVITLRRLRKKHAADTAASDTALSTIKTLERFAISTVADDASTSRFPSAASCVGSATP
jgi:hypothetical protein